MRNELQKHKKSDRIKWALTSVGFVLAFVLIAGLCLQLFGTGKTKPSEWFKKSDMEQTQTLPDDGKQESFVKYEIEI